MRRSIVALVPVAGALILAACVGDRESTASRLNAPAQALSAGNPNACDFSGMTRDARTALSSRDTVISLIGDMQKDYGTGGTAGATTKGLDILAQIAKKRLTSAQGGAIADVAVLVNDILSSKCSDILVGVSDATKAEFNAAASLTNGVFEVRGGTTPAPAAVAFVAVTPATTPISRVEVSPRWGIEPQAGCTIVPGTPTTGPCSWPSITGTTDKRYLLFAYPFATSVGGETPSATSFSGLNGFKVGMMPDIGNKSVFTLGTCDPALVKNGTTPVAVNLLLHVTSTTTSEVIGNRSPSFCATGYPPQAMLITNKWFASLARLGSWLQPTQLFAQELEDKFSGGGPSGWSPITFANFTGSGTNLAFGPLPKNTSSGVFFDLTVIATSAAGHPLPGVNVNIDLSNNSGIPAGATFLAGSQTQDFTNASGIATFHIGVNKAGGYTFVATGDLSHLTVNGTVSLVLNVKNGR